jgi:hypothetical protein
MAKCFPCFLLLVYINFNKASLFFSNKKLFYGVEECQNSGSDRDFPLPFKFFFLEICFEAQNEKNPTF